MTRLEIKMSEGQPAFFGRSGENPTMELFEIVEKETGFMPAE